MSETATGLPAIEQAGMKDFDELKALLDTANRYSIELSGLPQWRMIDLAYDDLRTHLESGDYYVVRAQDGSITSAIGLSENSEDWGEREDGRGLHFGKLMKNPTKAQPDEGVQLIGFAAAETLRRGKALLRCDVVAELPGLVDYYLRLGFENRGGFIYKSSGRPGIFLEANPEAVLARIQARD